MSKQPNSRRSRWITAAVALAVALVPWGLAQAGKSFQDRRDADASGSIELIAVSGTYELIGTDKPEVVIAGTTGSDVERVDVATNGSLTTIHVVPHTGPTWGATETHLVIHVPAMSSIKTSLVSADLKITGISGSANLQAVSGDIHGDVGGDLRLSTVSGDVKIAAQNAHTIEAKSISGDLRLSGGSGEADVTTVSGNAKITLATLNRGRFKTVSGDVTASFALSPDAQLDGQSVSGTIRLDFGGAPAAEFDVQSFSGDIDNCFGPKPVESKYGPGSRLSFKNGEGHAHVRIETQSGDVKICDRGAPAHAAIAPGAAVQPASALPVGGSEHPAHRWPALL